jgi:hypothetical protein
MKAVMYGGGNIGRGFIGALFSASGYNVTFVDVAKPVVESLNEKGSYPVRILKGATYEDVDVQNVCAVDGNDQAAVAKAIAEADIMALQLKLKRHKYDMIVLTNNAAVNLFLDGKLEAAPGTPLLVAAYHGELPAEKAARINMTGVLTPATLSYNIQLSTKLLPLNRKVTVLVESSADTVALEEDFRKRYDDAKTKKLDVQFIRGREYTTAEMLQKISVLPSDSVLIFHSWASLKDTEPLDYFLILPRVRKQFKGLLLGRFRELIEKGASGGYMVSGFLQGKEAGQIAGDIFHKKKSPSSPFQLGYYRAVFDYPSLLKYKVDFQYLPENSLILNKPIHFLARHYEVIIGIIIVLLVILIILLLRLRAHRKFSLQVQLLLRKICLYPEAIWQTLL